MPEPSIPAHSMTDARIKLNHCTLPSKDPPSNLVEIGSNDSALGLSQGAIAASPKAHPAAVSTCVTFHMCCTGHWNLKSDERRVSTE